MEVVRKFEKPRMFLPACCWGPGAARKRSMMTTQQTTMTVDRAGVCGAVQAAPHRQGGDDPSRFERNPVVTGFR